MKTGITPFPRLLAAVALVLVGTASVAQNSEGDEVRYATVASEEAHVRNLPDVDGVSIARPAKGSLVSIHGEMAGWYEVQVPGGCPVWVFGRYLRPVAGETDVYEVTRNAVNIRPAPKSDVLSFPLPQRLHAGDRVRAIELLDPSAELATTWVRIWSPPGVHAWMRSTDTNPLPAGQDGSVRWKQAMASLGARVAPSFERPAPAGATANAGTATGEAKPASAGLSAADTKARETLEEVRKLLEAEIEKPTPDFGTVRARLQELRAKAPSGEIAVLVGHELDRVALFEEVARVQGELQKERERRAEEARRRQQEAWEASVAKDPLGHAFLSRGVLLREADANGTPRYRLRFGREIVSELVCASGRYDLDAFAGFEVGVRGETLQTTGDALDLMVIDVTRLEVTARR